MQDGEVLVAPADQPRLDADRPPGGRAGDRHRRRHLPRRDRRPRARRARRRRHPHGARRTLTDGMRGHRRRRHRPGLARRGSRPRPRRHRSAWPDQRHRPRREIIATGLNVNLADPAQAERGRRAAGRRRRPAARRAAAHAGAGRPPPVGPDRPGESERVVDRPGRVDRHDRPGRSHRGRSSTGPPTCAATSSAAWPAARTTSRSRTTR